MQSPTSQKTLVPWEVRFHTECVVMLRIHIVHCDFDKLHCISIRMRVMLRMLLTTTPSQSARRLRYVSLPSLCIAVFYMLFIIIT